MRSCPAEHACARRWPSPSSTAKCWSGWAPCMHPRFPYSASRPSCSTSTCRCACRGRNSTLSACLTVTGYRNTRPTISQNSIPGTYMLWALVGIVLAIYNLPFHAGRAGAVFLHAACGALLRLAHQRCAVHPHAECVLSPVPLSSWDGTSLALVLDFCSCIMLLCKGGHVNKTARMCILNMPASVLRHPALQAPACGTVGVLGRPCLPGTTTCH